MADKVFLITGASSGIGLATAQMAAEGGYRLALAARSYDKLEVIARNFGDADRALPIQCDVASWKDQENLVKVVLEHFGQIDCVLANAGFGRAKGGFSEGDPEMWRAMILTNMYGVALTIRACLASLKASKGHLVLMGSATGRRVYAGSIYSCTKWAITAMAESVRQELVGSGVRVTLLAPGGVNTPFHAKPIPGALTAEDVARAVMFAINQPASVNVNELLIRPTAQEL